MGYQQSEPANVADVGRGLGVLIGNLGGSPLTNIAASSAEPSAEMSSKNVKCRPADDDKDDISAKLHF